MQLLLFATIVNSALNISHTSTCKRFVFMKIAQYIIQKNSDFFREQYFSLLVSYTSCKFSNPEMGLKMNTSKRILKCCKKTENSLP